MNRYKQLLYDKMKKVDDLLTQFNFTTLIYVIGGAAFVLQDLIPRATTDIDYINQTEEDISNLLQQGDINNQASIFSDTFGDDYQKDAVESEFEFQNLKVFYVNKYRLLSSRLFSDKRYDDIEWIFANKEIELDQEKFESIFKEIHEYAIYNFEKSFKDNKYIVMKGYKERGWDYENSIFKKLYEK